jgi:hypothetical protein
MTRQPENDFQEQELAPLLILYCSLFDASGLAYGCVLSERRIKDTRYSLASQFISWLRLQRVDCTRT